MKNHIIEGSSTIVEALDALNRISGETMTLFVTGPDGLLIGSLTDGDVRRALLAGRSLSGKVSDICNRGCLVIDRSADAAGVLAEARKKGISLLPVVSEGRIISLVDLRHRRGLVPADGVLMAGGRGERLRPLTEKTPKPLLPVGEKPIIDHNLELMGLYGIENVFVTVNFLKEQIIGHIEDYREKAGKFQDVRCVEENQPLGTIGSLSLIRDFANPNIVVMNADLLTDINLEAMYLKHIETEAWLTMAVVPYTLSVPYAIVEHNGDRVEGFTEKPTYNYFANAGIYMLRREAVEKIEPGRRMDATDLIEILLAEGKRVSLYNIEGRWIDIGSPDDYRHACEIMRR